MSSAYLRPITVEQHPVIQHQYIVPTPNDVDRRCTPSTDDSGARSYASPSMFNNPDQVSQHPANLSFAAMAHKTDKPPRNDPRLAPSTSQGSHVEGAGITFRNAL